jgi:hypothetical protein
MARLFGRVILTGRTLCHRDAVLALLLRVILGDKELLGLGMNNGDTTIGMMKKLSILFWISI